MKLFISILIFGLMSSQKIRFEPSIKVQYDASLQLGEKYKQFQKFVLVGNSQDYYFAAIQNYLNDTKQYEAKNVDTKSISDYFRERLIKYDNNTTVFYTDTGAKISYSEPVEIKWVLYGETKLIEGVLCQLATTNKYGRRWYAYFSKDYPQQLGPYKFGGLPGLIFELYDTRNDYHFTLSKVEKFNNEFTFNLGGFKNYKKSNYIKAKNNMDFSISKFPQMDLEQNKFTQNMLDKLKAMYNNPLELKPFD